MNTKGAKRQRRFISPSPPKLKEAVKHVLKTRGTLAEAEVKLPIMFEGVQLESGFLINFNIPHLKDGIKRIVV